VNVQILVGLKVRMARFKLGVSLQNEAWQDHCRANLTVLHRLQDTFYDWGHGLVVSHQVFFTFKLLEDSLCAVFCLLEDFKVEVEFIIHGWSVVAFATLVNSLQQILVSKEVVPDYPVNQLDFVERPLRLKRLSLVTFCPPLRVLD
jgi:hypothetical protein